MLERLFGNQNTEKILFFLLENDKCYGTQLSKYFESALSGFQNTLDKLEYAGVLVSFLEGRTRIYQFNPTYPFLNELTNLLKRAYEFLPDDIKEKYYEKRVRRRPRRKGKPL
ncbi:MAG: hypothetical protein K1000chlam2_01614 [Chlamydiae bacterium]|nr:hypothetical protein [Chlamydiota bacterium]